MVKRSVTVLSGGNTGFSVAANLTLGGWRVTLGEIPGFAHMLDPILQDRIIHLDGVAHTGAACLAEVTTDLGTAVAANDLVLLIVPAYGHRPFAEACAASLRGGHVVVLLPGTLGSLEFLKIVRNLRPDLKIGGHDGLTVAESDTAPYVCRKTAPDTAHIWGVVDGMGYGVYPAGDTERVHPIIDAVFPGARPYRHVLECGLSAMNPVVHPAGVLLNAGRIERSRGDFYFYEEGVTPAVCRAVEAVDAERRSLGRAIGCNLLPVAEAFHAAGFGPAGDLWAAINGSRMLTQLRAPGAIHTRWLSEDIPYGIASWAQLGTILGVATPVMRSLVDLGSAVLGTDCWKLSRTPDDLGLNLPADQVVPAAQGTQT